VQALSDRLRDLGDRVIERPSHRFRERHGVVVLDSGPGVEGSPEDGATRAILERDREGDVGLVFRGEDVVEGEHVDVERGRVESVREP